MMKLAFTCDAAASQVNANLKADTTDELLGRKRSMHMTAFQYRIDEISKRLRASTPASFLNSEFPSLDVLLHFSNGRMAALAVS